MIEISPEITLLSKVSKPKRKPYQEKLIHAIKISLFNGDLELLGLEVNSILNLLWNFQNFALKKYCVTFNFGQIRGQKNLSGTWIYLSKVLLPPKVSFYLSFYRKCSLGK